MAWNLKKQRGTLKEEGTWIYTRCLQKRLSHNTNSNPSHKHWAYHHPVPLSPLTRVFHVSWSCRVQWTQLWRSPVYKAITARWLWQSSHVKKWKPLPFLIPQHFMQLSQLKVVLMFEIPHLTGDRKLSGSHFCHSQMTALTVCNIRWNSPVVVCRKYLSDASTPRMFSLKW